MNSTISLDEEITQYLSHLNEKQKRAVLTVVKAFTKDQKDWWNEISQQQQQDINKALAELQDNKLTPHEEVMKKYKKL